MTNDRDMYEAFLEVLNQCKPGWRVTERGLCGPEGDLVRLAQRHPSQAEGHVDVGFVLDTASPTRVELWDCVAGVGATPAARAQFAAHLWLQTAAAALLELKYSRRGEFADHYRGTDHNGFPAWHIICGAVVGFGKGESPGRLQRWWLENSVLPTVARALSSSLNEQSCPHGIKILFGGDGVAEVRLDGEEHHAASMAVAALAWPRLDPPGFVRSYVIVLHREETR
jgi:uncharacterized protein DUF6348